MRTPKPGGCIRRCRSSDKPRSVRNWRKGGSCHQQRVAHGRDYDTHPGEVRKNLGRRHAAADARAASSARGTLRVRIDRRARFTSAEDLATSRHPAGDGDVAGPPVRSLDLLPASSRSASLGLGRLDRSRQGVHRQTTVRPRQGPPLASLGTRDQPLRLAVDSVGSVPIPSPLGRRPPRASPGIDYQYIGFYAYNGLLRRSIRLVAMSCLSTWAT